ncbi:MAG: pantoate--beta-alanine ligase [Alphaproteobacteria bacterium]
MSGERTGAPAVVRTVHALRERLDVWRRAGETIALVPTMGGLHEGHLSLVRRARALGDRVCVTIFVNPTQFAPDEDFDTYPRDEAADVRRLAREGADLVFAPGVDEIYPPGHATRVTVAGLSDCLCGVSRPDFFTGVATVVATLLIQALPDVAVFGEKDYQQLLVIRRLVRDLSIPLRIVGAPTVREADGLAMSSRNHYLSAAERRIAPELFGVLTALAGRLAAGDADIDRALAEARRRLDAAGFTAVEYLELRDAETLAPLSALDRPARLFAAVRLGSARLIDNLPVGG